ncbi:AraC family transcriptional regulator [uncultured Algibacter sp.]|uniref:helix-turn-helix domain-containing protein n=1 Tax=uncultured Algibacter sp. TaxID=298659 RepID=UPI0026122540|nr:helix-turn-helix domain-containing protein [uncultured Algibacter sp.]
MDKIIIQIFEYYNYFGLLNIFLLFILLLAYSKNKRSLWYGLFILSIALDLFNYKGLYWLFNYSSNFTLPYLPWKVFSSLALFKLIVITYEIKNIVIKKVTRFLTTCFLVAFSYFIFKSYWILLGDLSTRDLYFYTDYLFPYIEYWVIKIVSVSVQIYVLAFGVLLVKKQSLNFTKDIYFLYVTLLVVTILSVLELLNNLHIEPNIIISYPEEFYLTIVTTLGLIISYRKLIGLDSQKHITKQNTVRIYKTDEDILLDVKEKLLKAMIELELYKNQKLQLKDLGKAVKTSESIVSEVLIGHLNTNFYDFINGYRVKEIIRLMGLEKYKGYKLMVLATESGFNSKTTFNTAFKKITGNTPSQYRRIHFQQKKTFV